MFSHVSLHHYEIIDLIVKDSKGYLSGTHVLVHDTIMCEWECFLYRIKKGLISDTSQWWIWELHGVSWRVLMGTKNPKLKWSCGILYLRLQAQMRHWKSSTYQGTPYGAFRKFYHALVMNFHLSQLICCSSSCASICSLYMCTPVCP